MDDWVPSRLGGRDPGQTRGFHPDQCRFLVARPRSVCAFADNPFDPFDTTDSFDTIDSFDAIDSFDTVYLFDRPRWML